MVGSGSHWLTMCPAHPDQKPLDANPVRPAVTRQSGPCHRSRTDYGVRHDLGHHRLAGNWRRRIAAGNHGGGHAPGGDHPGSRDGAAGLQSEPRQHDPATHQPATDPVVCPRCPARCLARQPVSGGAATGYCAAVYRRIHSAAVLGATDPEYCHRCGGHPGGCGADHLRQPVRRCHRPAGGGLRQATATGRALFHSSHLCQRHVPATCAAIIMAPPVSSSPTGWG